MASSENAKSDASRPSGAADDSALENAASADTKAPSVGGGDARLDELSTQSRPPMPAEGDSDPYMRLTDVGPCTLHSRIGMGGMGAV